VGLKTQKTIVPISQKAQQKAVGKWLGVNEKLPIKSGLSVSM
jgi:hypothetical protein